MTKQFEINPYNLLDIGSNGYGSISARIDGYWSSDPITLYISREYRLTRSEGGWKITLSHSSGGREPKQVKDDMDAAINFAAAMTALASLGKEIRDQYTSALEAAYQVRMTELRQLEENARAARVAKIEADKPYGMSRATGIIESMNNGHLEPHLFAYERGSDENKNLFEIRISQCGEKRLVYVDGYRHSKEKAISMLAACSARAVEKELA